LVVLGGLIRAGLGFARQFQFGRIAKRPDINSDWTSLFAPRRRPGAVHDASALNETRTRVVPHTTPISDEDLTVTFKA